MRAIIIVLALTGVSEAQLFRRCRAPVKVVKQVVVKEVVQQVVAPVGFVLLPQPVSYGAPSYQAPQQRAQTTTSEARLATAIEQMVVTLEQFNTRLIALERRNGPQVGAVEVPQIIAQQCGKCHGQENYELDGDGISFAMIAGELNDKALSAVGIRKTMPKLAGEGESIPDDLRTELVAALQEMRR